MSRFLANLAPYLQAVQVPGDKTFFLFFKLCGNDRDRSGRHPHHLLVFCKD